MHFCNLIYLKTFQFQVPHPHGSRVRPELGLRAHRSEARQGVLRRPEPLGGTVGAGQGGAGAQEGPGGPAGAEQEDYLGHMDCLLRSDQE